jgi:hypothetical protein
VERGEPDGPLTEAWEAARRSMLELGEWEMGGGDECGEKGRAPRPFIGSEGSGVAERRRGTGGGGGVP